MFSLLFGLNAALPRRSSSKTLYRALIGRTQKGLLNTKTTLKLQLKNFYFSLRILAVQAKKFSRLRRVHLKGGEALKIFQLYFLHNQTLIDPFLLVSNSRAYICELQKYFDFLVISILFSPF